MKLFSLLFLVLFSSWVYGQIDNIKLVWPEDLNQQSEFSYYDGQLNKLINIRRAERVADATDSTKYILSEWDVWNNIPGREIEFTLPNCSNKDYTKPPIINVFERSIIIEKYCPETNNTYQLSFSKKDLKTHKEITKKNPPLISAYIQGSNNESLDFRLDDLSFRGSSGKRSNQKYVEVPGINNSGELDLLAKDSIEIKYNNGNYIYVFEVQENHLEEKDTITKFYKDYFELIVNNKKTILEHNYAAGSFNKRETQIALLRSDFITIDIYTIEDDYSLTKLKSLRLPNELNGDSHIKFNNDLLAIDNQTLQIYSRDNNQWKVIKWSDYQSMFRKYLNTSDSVMLTVFDHDMFNDDKVLSFRFGTNICNGKHTWDCLKLNVLVNKSNAHVRVYERHVKGDIPSSDTSNIIQKVGSGIIIFNKDVMTDVINTSNSFTGSSGMSCVFSNMQAIGLGSLLDLFPVVTKVSDNFKAGKGWHKASVDGKVYSMVGHGLTGGGVTDCGEFTLYNDSVITGRYTHYDGYTVPEYSKLKWTGARSLIKKPNGLIYYSNSEWIDSDQTVNPAWSEQIRRSYNQLKRMDSVFFVNIFMHNGDSYKLQKTIQGYAHAFFINKTDLVWLIGTDKVVQYNYIKDSIVNTTLIPKGIPILKNGHDDLYIDGFLPFSPNYNGEILNVIDNNGTIHRFNSKGEHIAIGTIQYFRNDYSYFSFSPNGNWILYSNPDYTSKINYQNNELTTTELPDTLLNWHQYNDSTWNIWSQNNYQILNKGGLIPMDPYNYNVTELYKYPNKTPVLSVSGSKDHWLFKAGKYFYGDKDVAKSINYKLNGDSYPYTQFDHIYNRPDTLMQIISDYFEFDNDETIQMLKKAYLKRIKRMGVNTKSDINELPKMQILNLSELPKISISVTLDVYAESLEDQLKSITIEINNVPVKTRLISDDKFQSKIKLDLAGGFNLIKVYCTDINGNNSIPIQIPIFNKPSHKKNLYLVAIGASRYKDKSINLEYAAKDAKDLIDKLSESPAYNRVYSKLLINESVTKDSLKMISDFLKSASIDDDVIIFYAGHGLVDDQLDYYLATHNVDVSVPSLEGLAYEDLEKLLNPIRSIRKVIILDACHSGEIDKEEIQLAQNSAPVDSDISFRAIGYGVQSKLNETNTLELSKSLFNDLKHGSGATVISSAGGMEFAIESDAWKNGLFTYSLLHGIESMIADLNGDGEIWLGELQEFTQKNVEKLSGGNQKPTSRLENNLLDFRLW